jgi:hypothetical protein
MADVTRVSPKEARDSVISGSGLLVCAYSDDAKFRSNRLEGAIPLSEFKVRLPDLDRDTQIIFYCA